MGKQSKKKGNFLTSAHQALQRKGVVTTVYLVLRLLVILVMVAQFFNRNFENVFLCILTLVLLLLPTVLERRLQIDLPNTLEIIIMLFIFAAGDFGRDPGVLHRLPLLGHHAPHSQRVPLRRHRLLPGGPVQPA